LIFFSNFYFIFILSIDDLFKSIEVKNGNNSEINPKFGISSKDIMRFESEVIIDLNVISKICINFALI
jgi:hypothetical protein